MYFEKWMHETEAVKTSDNDKNLQNLRYNHLCKTKSQNVTLKIAKGYCVQG